METVRCSEIIDGFINSGRLLTEKQNVLNKLNYFPVADKDTGTNMALSFRNAISYLNTLPEKPNTPKEAVDCLSTGLLSGSQGNSGSILAIFFLGMAEVLPETPEINGTDLAGALLAGAKKAEIGIARPTPGTILSVAKDAAEAGISFSEMTVSADEIWRCITAEAHSSLHRTAFLNPILQGHGIADAGAYGFTLVLDGFHEIICPDMDLPGYDERLLSPTTDFSLNDLIYPFCTELVLENAGAKSAGALSEFLNDMGDCLILIEKEGRTKVHIHTSSPDLVVQEAVKYGNIISQKIDDMRVTQ